MMSKVQARLVKQSYKDRDGKRRRRRFWSIRYRIGDGPYRDKSTGVRDEQVAQNKLRIFVDELEREAAGVGVSRKLRDSVSKPLVDHVRDYVDDLAERRDPDYVYTMGKRLEKLILEAPWASIRDIDGDSFKRWRKAYAIAKGASPKTLNQYLDSLSGFINWLVRQGRMLANPLLGVVEKLPVYEQVMPRRAFSDDEMSRLLAVAGPHKLAILLAFYTGLRRGELELLTWDHVHLDAPKPFLSVPAKNDKGRKDRTLWLHEDLVVELKVCQQAGVVGADGVLAGSIPSIDEFRAILEAAEIAYIDASGRRADFHSLRHTLATNLHKAGVSARTAMEVMRHSDLRLTMSVYTDAEKLPTLEAIEKLPRFGVDESNALRMTGTNGKIVPDVCSHGCSQNLVNQGLSVSAAVQLDESTKMQNPSEISGKSNAVGTAVPSSQEVGNNWGTRIRTYKGTRKNQPENDVCSHGCSHDPDLRKIIDSWQNLDKRSRKMIVSAVETAIGR